MAAKDSAEIMPSGEAAKLVEKWLGLSSLSGLYQSAEGQAAQAEARMPGLGLGASLSVKQQARSKTGGVERILMKRIAGPNKPTMSSHEPSARQHADPPSPGGSLGQHASVDDDFGQEDGRAQVFSAKTTTSSDQLISTHPQSGKHRPPDQSKRKKKRFKSNH